MLWVKRDFGAYLNFMIGQFCLFAFESAKVNEIQLRRLGCEVLNISLNSPHILQESH